MHRISFSWRIFFIAMLVRLVPVLLTRSLGIGLDDMFQYDMLARSLASGNGYRWYAQADLNRLKPYVNFDLSTVDYDPVHGIPTSFRPPLYPTFLALVYLLAGSGAGRFFVARLVQAGLGAALAPLTYKIARRIFPDQESASVISAWTVALYPILVVFPLGLATENLFIPLVIFSFYFLLKTLKQPATVNFLISGLLLGLSALTRSVILVFCGLVLAWFWFQFKEQRHKVFLTFLILTLTISPWVVRNSLLNGRLSGIETALGYQLYVGHHPDGNGTFLFGPSLDLLTIADDNTRDRVGTEKALEFIRADPGRALRFMLYRLGYFFGLERRALTYFYSNGFLGFFPLPSLLVIAVVFFSPFVIIALSAPFGLATAQRSPEVTLLWLLVLGYLLPHLFIISEERFHLTLVPLIAILAARAWTGGWQALVKRWNVSRLGKLAVFLAICVAILLLLNWGLELTNDADKIAALLGPNGNQTYFPY